MKNKEVFLRLINNYVKRYYSKLFVALILSILVAASTSAIAWILDPAVKKIFLDKDQTMLYLIPLGIVVAFCTKGISLYLVRYVTISVGLGIRRDIKQEMAEKVLISDIHQLNEKHSGKFISYFIYDSGLITEMVSQSLLRIMKESLTLIGLLILMFYQNWKLALFALIMMPFAIFVSRTLGKRMGKATKEAAENSANLMKYLSEMLGSIKLIKIYQKEKYELSRAQNSISNLINKLKKMEVIGIRATPIMEVLTGFIIAAFIIYSGQLVISGELGINNFFSFLAAMMLSYQPIRALASINIGINSGLAAADRIFEMLDTETQIKDDSNAKKLSITRASIDFKNVNFLYPGQKNNALNNININIEGGKTIAIVGHSGAGKSTIFNLLPRFYDVKDGEILVDNQLIKNVSLSSLRKNLSLVSQDVFLFDDTVYANIAYANLDSTKEKVIEASKAAAADEFIMELPDKYESIVGENGIKLSGGQKQRISIARALLKNSPIILLDEATSSLDAESESKVQNAINNLTKNKTTIIIAHRLSTIKNAEKIFVLNEGKIAASGNHEELLNSSKIYSNLYNKQIKSF